MTPSHIKNVIWNIYYAKSSARTVVIKSAAMMPKALQYMVNEADHDRNTFAKVILTGP